MSGCRSVFTVVMLLVAGVMTGCQSGGPYGHGPVKRDGVFVHVRSGPDDPHAVLMALRMATLMVNDRDVLVYFDLRGAQVVLNDAPDITFPPFDSSKAQLKALIDRGVPLYVCPGCLKVAGKKPEDLLPGVKVAEKEGFFNFTKGRILTLDY